MTLLLTKLNRPSVTPRLILRSKLIEKIEKGSHVPVIMVVAPAGYGKSIAISQWVEKTPAPAAWISLDEGLNDFPTFLTYLLEAIERKLPQRVGRLKQLVQGAYALTANALSKAFINQLNTIESRFVLVLDDYHLITNPEVHTFLEILLEHPPGSLQLILIARRNPPLQLKKLSLYEKVLHIRMQELAFDLEEVKVLLGGYSSFRQEDAESLWRQSEGWPIGMNMLLATSSLSGKFPGNGPGPLARDLDHFVELLTEPFSKAFSHALHLSACCNRFNPELLEALFQFHQIPISATYFLQEVNTHNLFITPLDDEAYWFRWHHLFRDLLRKRCLRENKGYVQETVGFISNWFSEHGLPEDALECATQFGAFDLATNLIARHRLDMLNKDRWWEVEKWINKIPERIQKMKIDLLLARLWIIEDTWQIENMPNLLESVEKRVAIELNNKLISEFYLHQGFYQTFIRSDGPKALIVLERSKALSQDYGHLGGRREMTLAVARHISGLTEEALKCLNALEKEHPLPDLFHLRIHMSRVFVLLLKGDLKRAEKACERFVFLAEKSDFTPLEGFSMYLQSNVLFQKLSSSGFQSFSDKALHTGGFLDFWAFFDVFAGTIIHEFLIGNRRKAWENLAEMKEQANEMKDPFFKEIATSLEYRLYWLEGDTGQALPWAYGDGTCPIPRRILFAMEVPEFTRIRILLTSGDAAQLDHGLLWLRTIREHLRQIHNQYHEVDLNLLEAIAHHRMGHPIQAKESFQEAKDLAGDQNWLRPFAELNLAIPELREMADQDSLPMMTLPTALSARDGVPRPQHSKSKATKGNDPLTTREIEIIQLVVQGLRNKEIADRLHLAVATVKSHLHRIFQKLDVPNRATLIVKVNKQDLLS